MLLHLWYSISTTSRSAFSIAGRRSFSIFSLISLAKMVRSSVGGIARMANYFDSSDSEWERGKAEMTSILQRVAAKRGMIAYSELASQMTTIRIEAFGMPMSEMHAYGEISDPLCHHQGRMVCGAQRSRLGCRVWRHSPRFRSRPTYRSWLYSRHLLTLAGSWQSGCLCNIQISSRKQNIHPIVIWTGVSIAFAMGV